ncbi:MAG TPA: zinc metalloprotease [Blastocatellia bacterium]|nr:zinc metalloprotease [Blastocatellia bacterium]
MAKTTRSSGKRARKASKPADAPARRVTTAARSEEEEPLLRRQCGTMQAYFRLIEETPGYRQRQAELERVTARRMLTGEARRAGGPVTIPVVVHVVFNTPQQNITSSQIKSQITALNRDFRAKNTDKSKVPAPWRGLVTDTGIQFALATTDPEGNATNGVTRTQTDRAVFEQDDTMKFAATGGVDAWPADRYLNIWVCRLAGGLLGYAQFPGGPAETDGVVINFRAFGTNGTATAPFNLGRTAVHEVGHYLNLRHIWGDTEDCSGSDFVPDTPKAQHPNRGKPTFPHISCSNGPNGDMFMNYMDYVDDDSMFMFTTQQVARMNATLDGARGTLSA